VYKLQASLTFFTNIHPRSTMPAQRKQQNETRKCNRRTQPEEQKLSITPYRHPSSPSPSCLLSDNTPQHPHRQIHNPMHPPQLRLPRRRQLGPNPRQLPLIKPSLCLQSIPSSLKCSRGNYRRVPPFRLVVLQPVPVTAGYGGRSGACLDGLSVGEGKAAAAVFLGGGGGVDLGMHCCGWGCGLGGLVSGRGFVARA